MPLSLAALIMSAVCGERYGSTCLYPARATSRSVPVTSFAISLRNVYN